MQATAFLQLYLRDLDKIYKEVESYSQEENIWKLEPGISNSAGNLCLHLVGSLNHFIGATIGNTGYSRLRDEEFTVKGLTREEILSKINSTKVMIREVISPLSQEDLEREFPYDLAGKQSVEFYLMFFAMHLNYHLGQINYHRRLLDVE